LSEATGDRPGFRTLDRAAWAAIGRDRASGDAARPPGAPVRESEWQEVYVPTAAVAGAHLEAAVDLRRRLRRAGLPGAPGPFLIGVAGSVAAGKSTFATGLAALLTARPDRPRVEVVGTDGFLLPNAVLAERGLLARKGFPESYDHGLFGRVLAALAAGDDTVAMPRYSHEVFDLDGDPQVLRRPDVVIIEGINAFAPAPPAAPVEAADLLNLRIYLDADEADLRRWYVERFVHLIDEARTRPHSFYARWAGLDDLEARRLAVGVWEHVNLPNLRDHIAPTRRRADLIVRKGSNHAVTGVAVRNR